MGQGREKASSSQRKTVGVTVTALSRVSCPLFTGSQVQLQFVTRTLLAERTHHVNPRPGKHEGKATDRGKSADDQVS